MPAVRTPPYLYEVIEAVISAGAGTVNIPDTVGYAIPQEFGKLDQRDPRTCAEQRQGGHLGALPQ